MRRFVRVVLVPAALTLAVAAVFHRSFGRAELALAVAAAVLFGGLGGWGLGSRRVPWPLGVVGAALTFTAGLMALVGRIFTPDTVPDAFVVFLTVGLPAGGLADLTVVPFTVLFAAMAAAVAASIRGRTLGTLVGPVVGMAGASVLVEPVGFGWWVPLVATAAISGVLLRDARNDLSQLPVLLVTNTDSRRQLAWWRPLVQVVPAFLAVTLLASVLPRAATFDVRRFVSPMTERLADPSPLALAARASRLAADDKTMLAAVRVDGGVPGRMRLAVLDAYAGTGWRQSADYSITGETLADDPLYPSGGDSSIGRTTTARSTVTVEGQPGIEGLRALPTAGTPESLTSPDGVRFAPRAGVLLADEPRSVRYQTVPDPTSPPNGPDAAVAQVPLELVTCPDSSVLSAIAAQLIAGTTSAEERLDRIENYLKVRRVYDPSSPGGQTIRSVERFLEQDYARGNLEVFVTTYALLARCADVPVRVVVGLSAPQPGDNLYLARALTAWVEVPLARAGWSPHDPLPTPDEQRQQAQLAQKSEPPEPESEPVDPAPPPREVEPRDVAGPAISMAVRATLALSAGGLLLAVVWALVVPAMVVRRRRRTADPTPAVHAAWATVTDALVDREVALDVHHTPLEVVRLSLGRVPVTLPRLLAGMAPLVDRARYSGDGASEEDAGLAWGYAAAVLERLPASARIRLVPLRRPKRVAARAVSTLGVARRGSPWSAALPDTAVISSDEAPTDLPGITVAARIGEGATGTVFRGVIDADGEPVAVKVFRYGPGDAGFDQQRYDWEVRIAREVSGMDHLPVVHAAGITPVTNRPYLVSSLYEGGTLLDRVRRGGPMTQAEAVEIGSDIAMALSMLHRLGVVHAEVKPENVFSGADGWVLGDLGSAWLRASRGPAASLTPPYAAPEVWRGASPTPAADLYSLALTMLFAATGLVPIASNAPAREDVAAAFSDHPVMLRALEPDARRRPRSVADFAKQLRPDLVGTPAGARLSGLSLPTPTVTYRRG